LAAKSAIGGRYLHETHAGMRDTTLSDGSNIVTAREHEVALLVARGLSNKAIARDLDLAEGTVKSHLSSIFRKLGIKRRYNLIHLYLGGNAA
jgi:DNA-binding NarL/FixJ family response regulator